MRLRNRLLLSYLYLTLVVLVALEVPLLLNVRERVLAVTLDQATRAAEDIARHVEEILEAGQAVALPPLVSQLASEVRIERQVRVRVILVGATGELLADSEGEGRIGENYATAERPEILRALEGFRAPGVRRSRSLGTDLLVVAVPVSSGGKVFGAVRLSVETRAIALELARATLALLGLAILALVGAMVLAAWLSQGISGPIGELTRAAEALGSGNLSARARVHGKDELARLASTFNLMAERLAAAIKREREFYARASHRLRTPLTALRLRLEEALAADPGGAMVAEVREALKEADRLGRSLSEILGSASPPQALLDPGALLAETATRWSPAARAAGLALKTTASPALPPVQAGRLREALDALVENAILHGGGEVLLGAEAREGKVRLFVADRGSGLPAPPETLFSPHFKADPASPGAGLGLALVREIAEEAGGSAGASPRPGGGSIFWVDLPAAGKPAETPTPREPPSLPPRGKRRGMRKGEQARASGGAGRRGSRSGRLRGEEERRE